MPSVRRGIAGFRGCGDRGGRRHDVRPQCVQIFGTVERHLGERRSQDLHNLVRFALPHRDGQLSDAAAEPAALG